MFKKITVSLLALVLGLTAMLSLQTTSPTLHANVMLPEQSITVSGQGQITAKPDMATITLGLETFDAKLEKATTNNAEKSNNIINLLHDFNIAKSDIKTTGYYVYPRFCATNYNTQIGHIVSNTITFDVYNLQNLDAIIHKLSTADINSLHGVQFGISNKADLYNQALQQALADANQKAVHLLPNGGYTSVYSIVENTPFGMSPYQIYPLYARDYHHDGFVHQGELEITANITATYVF